MDDKIIIDRMDAEEFLSMLTDAAMQGDNVTQYYPVLQHHADHREHRKRV